MQAGLLAAVDMGQYVSGFKAIPLFIALLVWAKMLTWSDKDALAAHMPRVEFNAVNLGGLILAFALFLALPNFFIAFPVFLVIMAIEVGVYLSIRNSRVGLADLKSDFAAWKTGLGGKKKEAAAAAGAVQLILKSGAVPPPKAEDPERGAYDAVQELFTDPLIKGAERIELSPDEGSAVVKYWVDGIRYDGMNLTPENANGAITYLKIILNMDVDNRRKPQTASMKVMFNGNKRDLVLNTSGTKAGESLAVDFDPKSRYQQKLPDIGLAPDQLALVEKTILEQKGVVLLSAPKGQGLTTMLYAMLRRHDAFVSHIQTVEHDSQTDLEGITQNKLSGKVAAGETMKKLGWVTSQQPDVVMVDRVDDQDTAREIPRYAGEGHLVYVGLRAGSTFDALAQWRKLCGDDKVAMKELTMVINARVCRSLCMACKVEYTPDPDTLKRLNMSPERVGSLFQARTQPLRDQKGNPVACEFCHDVRFKGRFGIFEIFMIDDDVKQTILSGGSINQLKMLFKKQKRKYLQENAVARAVAGDTSLQEIARVLRIGTESSSPPSSSKPAPV